MRINDIAPIGEIMRVMHDQERIAAMVADSGSDSKSPIADYFGPLFDFHSKHIGDTAEQCAQRLAGFMVALQVIDAVLQDTKEIT